jgi:transposase InsO family protein
MDGRTDRGGEFNSNGINQYCSDNGIIKTLPYTSHNNGKAERLNRTILERALAMLPGSGLPTNYFLTANYLRNRTPTLQSKDKTPFEKFQTINLTLLT